MVKSYVDAHCHILPKVDDGASSIERSVIIAKMLVDYGYETVVATPHFNISQGDEYINKTVSAREQLVSRLEQEKIKLNIKLGYEVQPHDSFIECDFIQKLLIEDSSYVLIEPTANQTIEWLGDFFYTLRVLNITPIIAHVERINCLGNEFDVLRQWQENDVKLQSNIASLTGKYGKDAKMMAKKLLKKEMIDCLGTDMHTPRDNDSMLKGFKMIKKITNDKYFNRIMSFDLNLM